MPEKVFFLKFFIFFFPLFFGYRHFKEISDKPVGDHKLKEQRLQRHMTKYNFKSLENPQLQVK